MGLVHAVSPIRCSGGREVSAEQQQCDCTKIVHIDFSTDVKFLLTTYLQQTFSWGAVDLALGRGCCCVQRNLDQVWDFLAAVFIC